MREEIDKKVLCMSITREPSNVVTWSWCIQSRIATLLLDRRSIDLSGAQEKEGHFHYKNFLRASK